MKKILFYYCLFISLFITISGVISSQNPQQLLFQLLFIPISIYFSYTALEPLFIKKNTIVKKITKPKKTKK